MGNIPLLIQALKESNKITTLALDYEDSIKKEDIDIIMKLLVNKHSTNLNALSLGNVYYFKILDNTLQGKIDDKFILNLGSFNNLTTLKISKRNY